MTERIVTVKALTRVEGEGALDVRIRGRHVEIAEFRIFEPPRFFEGLLQGRDASEAPDITSRICGSARRFPTPAISCATWSGEASSEPWPIDFSDEVMRRG